MEAEEAERSFLEIQSGDFSSRASEAAIHPAARGISETNCFLVGENNTVTAIVFLMSSNIHEHLSLVSAGKGWLAQEGKENLVCDAHMGNCVIFQFKPHVLGVSWRKAT